MEANVVDALGRLTENEKDCLRRRLLPQTAKEMALDLGVSVHAIEKRLKMARAKLGLASSLEAARILVEVEGYGRLGPQAADLGTTSLDDDKQDASNAMRAGRTQTSARILGGATLGLILMILLAVALAPYLTAPLKTEHRQDGVLSEASLASSTSKAIGARDTTPATIRAFIADSFRVADRNRSGFIEANEAPSRYGVSAPYRAGERPSQPTVSWITGPTAQQMWIGSMDTDADGRVSEAEYSAKNYPIYVRIGVPANWKRGKR